MSIPYRTRCVLKRIGVGILILAAAFVVVALYLFADLEQYVVYTRQGAKLDFSISNRDLKGEAVVRQPLEAVKVYYYNQEETEQTEQELSQIIGYYITADELEDNFDAVLERIRTLPPKTPVMLDLKSIHGNFFYSSAVSSNRNSDVDIAAMDSLIRELCNGDYYVIARMPALRDMLYGLNNVEDGLAEPAGYLWMDSEGCYWLDPTSDGTQVYLVNIANELKGLGFDEVLFTDYYFPDTERIVFKEDKQKALANTAKVLVNACASDRFAVSFTVKDYFEAPSGRNRMYLENALAADAETLAEQFKFADPAVRVVFLTTIHDTRFDDYSVLRPIADAEAVQEP